jgi:hypothetical protein
VSGEKPLVGLLLLALAALLIGVFAWRVVAGVARRVRWTSTWGTVERVIEEPMDEGTCYLPVVGFQDHRGVWRSREASGSLTRPPALGARIWLVYDPDDPDQISTETLLDRYFMAGFVVFILGLFLVLIGWMLAFGPLRPPVIDLPPWLLKLARAF